MEYYSAIKKEWTTDVSRKLDGSSGNYAEWKRKATLNVTYYSKPFI